MSVENNMSAKKAIKINIDVCSPVVMIIGFLSLNINKLTNMKPYNNTTNTVKIALDGFFIKLRIVPLVFKYQR